MGLGPSVCQYCKVLAEYDPSNKHNAWYCPICGNRDCNEYTGFNMDKINQCNENRRILEFFKGNIWVPPTHRIQ